MDLLYKSDNIEISFEAETQILYSRWLGHQDSELIRKSGEALFALFLEKQVKKVLNDNRLVIGPWYDAVDWAAQDWFPQIMNAGLRHFAWILPSTDVFAKLSAMHVVDHLNATGVIEVFYNYEDAYDWLKGKV